VASMDSLLQALGLAPPLDISVAVEAEVAIDN
jgi:hypothetical protein